MISRRRETGTSIRRGAKSIALFGAVLILAAQFLALSHFHQGNPTRQFNAQAQVATDVLQRVLHITELHEGENFHFGYQAKAGIDSLEMLGRELGFGVRVYTPQSIRRSAISSSTIRQLINEGEVSHVRALLGRSFAILSTPASGRGYGTRYTVPTINLAPYTELLPANGVYITTLTIGTGDSAETLDAVTAELGSEPYRRMTTLERARLVK